MIRLSIFCPFERISSFLYNKAAAAKAVRYKFSIDGFGGREITIDKLGPNRALGYSVQDRERILAIPVVNGSVDFFFENGEIVRRKICIKHELLTNYPIAKAFSFDGKDNLTNGDIAGEKVGYIEAAPYILTEKNVIPAERHFEVKNSQVLRPFYGYISVTELNEEGERVYCFYGPAAPTYSATNFCSVRTNGIEMKIFKAGTYNESPEKTNEMNKMSEELGNPTLKVFYRFDNQLTPFVISQIQPNLDGRLLRMRDIFMVLSISAFIESLPKLGYVGVKVHGYDESKNEYVVDLQPRGSMYAVVPEVENDFYHYCADNERLRFITDFLSASDKALHVTNPSIEGKATGKDGKLISNDSTSCFALCLSYILSCVSGGSYTDFVLALKACFDQGIVSVDENGHVYGQTAALIGKPRVFELPSLNGGNRFTLSRADFKEIPKGSRSGLAILGFDPKTENRFKGQPDHYVVVFADSETQTLSLIYDPLQYLDPGVTQQDLTGFLRQDDDSMLITFKVDSEKLASLNGSLIYNV